MMPATTGGLGALACISAMQKCIRRGMEREAMELAVELGSTSKNYAVMVANRLEIISHEDIGLASPDVITLVATCVEQAKRHYDPKRPGKWRMPVGTAIRAMSRALKSREGDHFAIVTGFQHDVGDWHPDIPDWAFDMHTNKGRQMGRGLEHFLEEGAKLDNELEVDLYKDEAIEWMKKKHGLTEEE